ncbi:MAG: MFS transporter [Actinomycetota bacterium]|nr:MFS transporter [Actinomycetota bacterium]
MSSPAGPAELPGLRRNANWRRLWLAQAVSLTGDSVFDITVMLWVAVVLARNRPWAPAAASGVLIAAAVPVLAVGPVAGVWIDRWDKRRIMMTADASRAAVIAALLLVTVSRRGLPVPVSLTAAYVVVAAESAFAQFFNPSRLALLGLTVAPGDRPRAGGYLQASAGAAAIIGPPIAAPMLFAAGIRWAIVIDAASFALSFAAISSIRLKAEPGEPGGRAGFRREFTAGLRVFVTSPTLVAMSAGVMICTLGTGALNALEVFFIRDNLHATAAWLGTFAAVIGGGAIAGALTGGRAGSRIGPGRVFWIGMVTGGLLLLAYSRLTRITPALAVLAAAGFMFGAINAAAPPILLALIPQNMMGRAMSVFNPLQQMAGLTSLAAAGLLAGTALRGYSADLAGLTLGPISTIFGASAILITAAGLAMIRPLSGVAAPARTAERPPAAGPGSRSRSRRADRPGGHVRHDP